MPLTYSISALPPELWPPGDSQPSQSLCMCHLMYTYVLIVLITVLTAKCMRYTHDTCGCVLLCGPVGCHVHVWLKGVGSHRFVVWRSSAVVAYSEVHHRHHLGAPAGLGVLGRGGRGGREGGREGGSIIHHHPNLGSHILSFSDAVEEISDCLFRVADVV